MSNKKTSLSQIIAKRKQSKTDKLQVKYYSSEVLGADIEIRKIPLAQYFNMIEEIEEEDGLEGMVKVVYEVCPMFKEGTKEAMEYYDVAEPIDLVAAVLEDQLNEIKDIIDISNSFYGMDKIEKDIKN